MAFDAWTLSTKTLGQVQTLIRDDLLSSDDIDAAPSDVVTTGLEVAFGMVQLARGLSVAGQQVYYGTAYAYNAALPGWASVSDPMAMWILPPYGFTTLTNGMYLCVRSGPLTVASTTKTLLIATNTCCQPGSSSSSSSGSGSSGFSSSSGSFGSCACNYFGQYRMTGTPLCAGTDQAVNTDFCLTRSGCSWVGIDFTIGMAIVHFGLGYDPFTNCWILTLYDASNFTLATWRCNESDFTCFGTSFFNEYGTRSVPCFGWPGVIQMAMGCAGMSSSSSSSAGPGSSGSSASGFSSGSGLSSSVGP